MRVVRFWERQAWTDKAASKLSRAVHRFSSTTTAGKRTADFLHGTWLGHPLHPPLTDVPVGSWTMASVLDAISIAQGRPPPRAAAQAIGFGILASLPTAAAGVMDWSQTRGSTRRLGSGHALLNTLALGCYCASLVARIKGGPGRLLSFAGLGIVSLSAYLGGHLVFDSKVGVSHAPSASLPREPLDVGDITGLAPGELRKVDVQGYPVALYRSDARIYAIGDVCPHMGCSLSEGNVQGDDLICPCHGSTFSLADGHIVSGPTAYPATVLTAEIRGDRIFISQPSEDT